MDDAEGSSRVDDKPVSLSTDDVAKDDSVSGDSVLSKIGGAPGEAARGGEVALIDDVVLSKIGALPDLGILFELELDVRESRTLGRLNTTDGVRERGADMEG